MTSKRAPFSEAAGTPYRNGAGTGAAVMRAVPEEVPVAISYDGEPYAVVMATPADIEDLGYGFSLTERIVESADEIVAAALTHAEEGLTLDMTLTKSARAARLMARRRVVEARSSCGLCGVERLAAAVRPLDPVPGGLKLTRAAIARALEALEDRQPLNRETHAVHAAGFADESGALQAVREDVGRHNALDKLIGALLRDRRETARGFCVITSRCSYEMVEKAARAGLPALVAISAPTALALRKALEARLALVALARRDGHIVFTDPQGVLADAPPARAPSPAGF